MGFRDRPEYKDWRDAVFVLYGRTCIRCGHGGNIHAHHVMPVEDYPELAFEPTNGVPLCGNCHVAIKGDEYAHADELRHQQHAILDCNGATATSLSEPELRERAYSDPSNADMVTKWFDHTTDSEAVADFYALHHAVQLEQWLSCGKELFTRCCRVIPHLRSCGRWEEMVEFSDTASRLANQFGILQTAGGIGILVSCKAESLQNLGRLREAVDLLNELVTRFPEAVELHSQLSVVMIGVFSRARTDGSAFLDGIAATVTDVLEASIAHALRAFELAPYRSDCASWASFVLATKRDFPSAIRYGKLALELASSNEDRIDALQNLAGIYMENNLYRDARRYLREAAQIDDCNTQIRAEIAHCHYMEGNEREALRAANQCLMIDPGNKACLSICKKLYAKTTL